MYWPLTESEVPLIPPPPYCKIPGYVYYIFSILQGYRALMGISVVQSCEAALSYYYKAAKKGKGDSLNL